MSNNPTLTLAALLSCGILAVDGLAVCDPGPCGTGQLWNGVGCLNCPDGAYMKLENHQCRSCIPCTENKPDLVKVKNCTAAENTKYKCKPGSVRYSNNDDDAPECKPCRDCPPGYKIVRECTGDTDTVCQPQSLVSVMAGEIIGQSTEASVGKESGTNHGPYWTNTSPQPSDNMTQSMNITDSKSTLSNITTDNRKEMICYYIIVSGLGVVIGFSVVIWCRCKRRRETEINNNEGANKQMLEQEAGEA